MVSGQTDGRGMGGFPKKNSIEKKFKKNLKKI
jgi:hypothetical protein